MPRVGIWGGAQWNSREFHTSRFQFFVKNRQVFNVVCCRDVQWNNFKVSNYWILKFKIVRLRISGLLNCFYLFITIFNNYFNLKIWIRVWSKKKHFCWTRLKLRLVKRAANLHSIIIRTRKSLYKTQLHVACLQRFLRKFSDLLCFKSFLARPHFALSFR